MKKDENIFSGDRLYEFFCGYAGIKFRLVSDDLFLKEIDFYKGKEFKSSELSEASAPVKIILQFFESYFGSNLPLNLSVIFRHKGRDIMVSRGPAASGSVVLDMEGYTDKEVSVYRELVKVASGEKISYGALAARCGIPGGARFIGNTMAKNRFPVIIPCHRVVKSDGAMGNFSGGVDIKEKLLRHEKSL